MRRIFIKTMIAASLLSISQLASAGEPSHILITNNNVNDINGFVQHGDYSTQIMEPVVIPAGGKYEMQDKVVYIYLQNKEDSSKTCGIFLLTYGVHDKNNSMAIATPNGLNCLGVSERGHNFEVAINPTPTIRH